MKRYYQPVPVTHNAATDGPAQPDGGSYTCGCNKGWTGDGWAQGAGCKDLADCASAPCAYGEGADEGAASCTCVFYLSIYLSIYQLFRKLRGHCHRHSTKKYY